MANIYKTVENFIYGNVRKRKVQTNTDKTYGEQQD